MGPPAIVRALLGFGALALPACVAPREPEVLARAADLELDSVAEPGRELGLEVVGALDAGACLRELQDATREHFAREIDVVLLGPGASRAVEHVLRVTVSLDRTRRFVTYEEEESGALDAGLGRTFRVLHTERSLELFYELLASDRRTLARAVDHVSAVARSDAWLGGYAPLEHQAVQMVAELFAGDAPVPIEAFPPPPADRELLERRFLAFWRAIDP